MYTSPSSAPANPLDDEIERDVVAALAEDVGSGDLTARLVPADIVTRATVVARENAVSVSYTHLDVYKRQITSRMASSAPTKDGKVTRKHRSVSITSPPACRRKDLATSTAVAPFRSTIRTSGTNARAAMVMASGCTERLPTPIRAHQKLPTVVLY